MGPEGITHFGWIMGIRWGWLRVNIGRPGLPNLLAAGFLTKKAVVHFAEHLTCHRLVALMALRQDLLANVALPLEA